MENSHMKKSIPAEVDTAFEILLEEIEVVIDTYAEEATKALNAREFDAARQMTDRAELITNFRQKVSAIRREWTGLEALPLTIPSKKMPSVKTKLSGRLSRGARTPESAYCVPILELIDEAGGSAQAAHVLEKLPGKMQDILKDTDFEPMSSSRDEPRWRNTARWARNTMVQDGRLKSDSQHGFWEITEQGRDCLHSTGVK